MKWIVALFLLYGLMGNSQNLVVNPSFEKHTQCPYDSRQISFVLDWSSPNGSTAEYFHFCGSNNHVVPHNLMGYQFARTGDAYIGFYFYVQSPSYQDYREYVYTELKQPLVNGREYEVSFYVSLGDTFKFAINKIGAYLSVEDPDTNLSSGSDLLDFYIPQINNQDTVFHTNDSIWHQISGVYTAQGGEKYITLGNFFSDANSTLKIANPTAIYPHSYYYIDDVSVTLVPWEHDITTDSIIYNSICFSDSSAIEVKFKNTGSQSVDFTVDTLTFTTKVRVNNIVVDSTVFKLTDNAKNPLPNVPLQSDSSMFITIFPINLSLLGKNHEITVEAVFKKDEDSTNNTVSITLTPVLDVGKLSVSPQKVCKGEEVHLLTTDFIGDPAWHFSENGKDWQLLTIGPIAVHHPIVNTYYRVEICGFLPSDSIMLQITEVPELEDFSESICGYEEYTLTPIVTEEIDQLNWYNQKNSNELLQTAFSYTAYFDSSQAFYVETVKDGCISEERSKVELILKYCPMIIPNAFTPNGDGLNDAFTFYRAAGKKLNTQIFDRWGNKVLERQGNVQWDGGDLPEGVYYYVVRETFENKETLHKGKVMLLR